MYKVFLTGIQSVLCFVLVSCTELAPEPALDPTQNRVELVGSGNAGGSKYIFFEDGTVSYSGYSLMFPDAPPILEYGHSSGVYQEILTILNENNFRKLDELCVEPTEPVGSVSDIFSTYISLVENGTTTKIEWACGNSHYLVGTREFNETWEFLENTLRSFGEESISELEQ